MLFRNNRWLYWDGLGGFLSLLCLIHCMVLPWLAALLPITLLLDESAHIWLFLALAPAAVMAAISGYRTHRQHLPIILIVPGVMLVGGAAFTPISESLEVSLTIVGSLLLIIGHLLNGRLKFGQSMVLQTS